MGDVAKVLVWGATGYTGRLVVEALARRGIAFAVGGRSREKVDALARASGAAEAVVARIDDASSLEAALAGRVVVCAVAGPFGEVGEPVVAAAARLGVHYLDTTGEQDFVIAASRAHDATARATGAAIAPAFAYEIAIADFGASLASRALGGEIDAIDVAYSTFDGGTSRGTRASAARVAAAGGARLEGGRLVPERIGMSTRSFSMPWREAWAASFPSPEAWAVPRHVRVRDVRTFMCMPRGAALAMRVASPGIAVAARLAPRALAAAAARGDEGPSADERARTRFALHVEARGARGVRRITLEGYDPYGITGALQALGAARALEGPPRATGVLAPSELVDPTAALDDLARHGFRVSTRET